ncbi:hypothetical protein GCM10022408_35220 [Hymenobacter fastidiosus]|uniref:Uncharacterized protein n=1 Tax=Hymenobacter fastidiosus TaxID=486264 RepID=A0ABP7SYL1_9BACT
MELDDLRRQWQQQPAPDSAAPDEAALRALLTQPSTSPVARMLRNARQEIISTVLILALTMVGLQFVHLPWMRPFGLLLLTASVLMGYYYYHKLRVLQRLGTTTTALRGHLEQQLQSLRSLLRLYYHFTMGTLVLMGSFLLYSTYIHLPQLFHGDARTLWQRGLWLGLTALISWLITGWITRWHLQRQYGRHLDRLESQLRELEG